MVTKEKRKDTRTMDNGATTDKPWSEWTLEDVQAMVSVGGDPVLIFWRLISAIKELKADMLRLQTTEEGRTAQAVRKPQKSWAHVARAKGMAVPSPTKCTEIIVFRFTGNGSRSGSEELVGGGWRSQYQSMWRRFMLSGRFSST